MKCIQATKDNNSYKKGHIARVENKEADLKVSTGYWSFVSKSLWKSERKGDVSETVVEERPKKKKSKKQD